jgi:hypothetical protein
VIAFLVGCAILIVEKRKGESKTMGYTHHWKAENLEIVEEAKYQKALAEMARVIAESPVPLANGMADEGSAPDVDEDGICFNGTAGHNYETFSLPGRGQELRDFDFCKTAQRPYDLIVVASLAILKDHLGEAIKVSSDGGSDDWKGGVSFASAVLGREIKNPIS